MATKNPKISVYVSDDLKAKLLESKNERRSNSLSAVVVEILEEYYGIAEPISNAQSNAQVEQNTKRIEALELQLQEILGKVDSEKHPKQQKKKSSPAANEGKSIQLDLPAEESSAEVAQSEVVQAKTQSNAQEAQILPTPEVIRLTGIKRDQLRYACKIGAFPKEGNGWRVLEYLGKLPDRGNRNRFWKIEQVEG